MAMAFRIARCGSAIAGRIAVFSAEGYPLCINPLGPAIGARVVAPSATPSIIRALSSSTPSALPQTNGTLNQEPATRPLQDAKPWSQVPKTKTTLGMNLELMKNPNKVYDYFQKQAEKLGYIFRLTGTPGLPEMVVVVNPKDVEAVFRVGDSDSPRRFPFYEWEEARKELKKPNGMFLDNGEKWLKQRIPISKFILMPRKMAEYHEPLNHVVQDYITYLRCHRHENDIFADIVESLNKWSLESTSLFVLGRRMGCLGDQMPPECKEFVESAKINLEATNKLLFGTLPLHRFWRTKTWRKMVNAQGTILSYASMLVEEKMKEIEEGIVGEEAGDVHEELGDDFLTYMVHSGKMDLEEIAANAVDLLAAGVDTTSLTMAACFYCLATNPDIQEKLREEVQRVVGQEAVVTPQHIQDMHYLRGTIKETMRMFPIVNNVRVLPQEVVLSGYTVPAGVSIIAGTTVASRLPEFFPEPEKFKPERWNRINAELSNSFASLPFGFGRRMCVGRRFAELEMHILLAQMIRNFLVEYRDEKPMEFVNKLFYCPVRRMDLALVDIH